MNDFRYLPGVSTLRLKEDLCIGCGACVEVCPHQVFAVNESKATIVDLDGCMECGACALNCPVAAITVSPGVGCASYIIQTWIKGKGAVIECC
ncbi:MAG: mercury methylation ferredoxin HgcB [Desulfobulbaceae bacterium]|nr:mercury methylation ferredoxin HgcB [Desulfobulbaceae bacterium]